MAIEILSLDEIDELFADLVQSVLELRADQVLISYPIKGQKSPKYNDTVVFVHTSQEQDNIQIYKNRKSEYNPVLFKYNTAQSSMRSLSVSFSFYGENCDRLATKFKERLYFDSTKQFLSTNKMSLIPSRISISSKVHEKINERWWERVDLNIGIYNTITVDETNDTFESVNIEVDTDKISIIIGGEN